eukprot:g8028.t1
MGQRGRRSSLQAEQRQGKGSKPLEHARPIVHTSTRGASSRGRAGRQADACGHTQEEEQARQGAGGASRGQEDKESLVVDAVKIKVKAKEGAENEDEETEGEGEREERSHVEGVCTIRTRPRATRKRPAARALEEDADGYESGRRGQKEDRC